MSLGRVLSACVMMYSKICGGELRGKVVWPQVGCLQSLEARRGIECRVEGTTLEIGRFVVIEQSIAGLSLSVCVCM